MILHVDMDAFYASVEERDNPSLVGKPVVVGGEPNSRGVVCAANYEARKFGVHSAMPAAAAQRRCPHAIFLRPRMRYYGEVSAAIRAIFHRFTPLVEPLSLDEAFLDVAGSQALFGPAPAIGQTIKRAIREEIGLIASVGVAANKFLAKLASDVGKPDGFVVVEPSQARAFLDPLPVGRLWGVGQVAADRLARLGIRTIGDLVNATPQRLRPAVGSAAEHLMELASGEDDRPVVPDRQAKSISHETTFATDIRDIETLRNWLTELCEQVGYRVRRRGARGRTVNLKLRHSDFRTVTRSHSLASPTDLTEEIRSTAIDLLDAALPSGVFAVRLLGVGLSAYDASGVRQGELFAEDRDKRRQLDVVTDQIRDRFGASSLARAAHLRPPPPSRDTDTPS